MLVMERDTVKRGTGTISEEKGPSRVPTTHAEGAPTEAEEDSASPTPLCRKQV